MQYYNRVLTFTKDVQKIAKMNRVLIIAILISSFSLDGVSTSTCSNITKWQLNVGKAASGGTQIDNLVTRAACLDRCVQDIRCVAVDVRQTGFPPECWLHFSSSYLDRVYDQPGTNQYQLIRCSTTPQDACVEDTWELYTDQTSVGANQYVGPRTIQQCLDYCSNTSNCVGVDIDVNVVPLGCWPHLRADDLTFDNTFEQRGTNQYRLISGCANKLTRLTCYNPDWSVFTNQSSTGGVQQAGPKSVQECLDYCGLMAAGCVAVDVDLNQSPPVCWLHSSTDYLKPSNVYVQPGVNQYRLVTKCFNDQIRTSTTTTTVAPTIKPDGSCSTWQVLRDQTSVGASLYSGPRTIKQCLDYCNNNTRCVAVDIDVNIVPLGCWVHVDANDLTADNTYDQRGTNQYIIGQRCVNNTVSGCYNPDWSISSDQSSTGGIQQAGPKSVQECLDYCGLMAAGCVAVDVDLSQSPPECWLHSSTDDLKPSNVYPQQGVNQYRLQTRCFNNSAQASATTTTVSPLFRPDGSCSTWRVIRAQTSVGASEYIGPRTIKQCLDYCNNNTRCVAVDIDVNVVPLGCWVHVDANDLTADNTYDQRGTNQYILEQRCLNSTAVSGCYNPDWSVSLNQSSANGVLQAGPTSVQECLDYCGLMAAGCVAVDVDLSQSPPVCWLHLYFDNLKPSNVYPQPGVNQYRLIATCTNNSAQASTTTTTTVAPTLKPGLPDGLCSTWQVLRDQSSVGATQYIGPRTIKQCLDYCNNNTRCVAVDIDMNVVPLGCWVHVDANDLSADNTYDQRGTNQYIIGQRCLNNTAVSGCYNPDWSVSLNQSSANGVKQAGPTSVQECLDYCGLMAAGCVAVDVDLSQSPPVCWLHLSSDNLKPSNVYPQPGLNQYRLIATCTNNSAQASTTTTTVAPILKPGLPDGLCSTWQVLRDQSSVGATQYIGPRTIKQCLDYCNNNTRCVAVDIDVNVVPLGCWVHVDANDLTADNTYDQRGTNQYIIGQRCLNSTESPACYNPDWSVLLSRSSTGGVQQFGPTSVQECLDVCGGNPTCLAADVDLSASPLTCWLHSSSNYSLAGNISRPGINQYRLITKCANYSVLTTTTTTTSAPAISPDIRSCASWDVLRNQNSIGASEYLGPRTIEQCLDYCNNNTQCVAVEIDVNVVPLGCWVHYDADNLDADNTYYQKGTNQYVIKQRCLNGTVSTSCYNPDWSVLMNQSSVNGVRQFGPASVQECLDVCGHSAKCFAVDVDLNQSPPTCWLYSSSDDSQTMFSRPGINQYRLLNNCTRSPVITTTTTTISPPIDIDGELWMVVRNRASTGAFPYIGPRTIQQCLDYCNSQFNCVAVDIDVNVVPVGCWIHASSIDLSPDNTYFQQGTNQYISVRKTPNKPAPTICYNPDWFVIANQSAAGAVQQIGPESVQECLDVCGHSATCSAVDVDLNQSPPTCWLYSNITNLLTMYARQGINQYRLLNNCTESSLLSTQSPIIPTISVTDVMRSTTTGATGEKNMALIVGLTVGLGVPFIIILTVLIIIFCCIQTPIWSSKDMKPSAAECDVESTPSVISATPSSSSSRAPIVGSSSQTHKPETSNYFYWAPERPEGTADLDRAYAEENTE